MPGMLLVLFAVSGCAALIYQVVWFQLLSFAIGASAFSLGVLLPTYLGGLCIGSLILPRYVSRKAHPLRVLGALELAIGALGVVALYAIPALGGLYSAWVGSGAPGLALRLLVAALALLPATILMGATLPAVAPWVESQKDPAAPLGHLYAANVAGAVGGCALAGFYLLRVHDAQVATFVAVALDFAVGLASFALAAAKKSPQSTTPASTATTSGAATATLPATTKPPRTTAGNTPAKPTGEVVWPVLVAAGLSGMTALCAEILWTRNLSLLFGGTVYAFAVLLAVFLLGLGAGSAAGAALGRAARRSPSARGVPTRALRRDRMVRIRDSTRPALLAARRHAPADRRAHARARSVARRVSRYCLPRSSGARASRSRSRHRRRVRATGERDSRRTVGALYAANTAGAIVGALATSFALIPLLGSLGTQQLSIMVAASAALLLLLTDRRGAALGTLSLAARRRSARRLRWPGPSLRCRRALVAYGRFLPTRGQDANVVYVGEGVAASIAVTHEPSGIVTYHNAGKTQASTYPQDMRLQRMLGHLATLIPEQPRSVFVIGLGAGITAGAVSIDPAVERVVVAEIEPLVIEGREGLLRRREPWRGREPEGRDPQSTTAATRSRPRARSSTRSRPTRSTRGSRARPRSTRASSGSSASRA